MRSAAFTRLPDEEDPPQHDDIELEQRQPLQPNEPPSDPSRSARSSSSSEHDLFGDPPSQRQHRGRALGRITTAWNSLAAVHTSGDHDHRPSPRPEERFNNAFKHKLFLLLEEPSSSRPAFWTNVVVSFLIVFSAVTTTIETIPSFRSAESNQAWFNLESAMVALFTLEYLLRMFAHSDSFTMLWRFFLSPITIIDFISIVPFYIELLAKRDTTYEFRFTILRLFRLLRLFKTYKYSNSIIMTIEVMMVALRRSGDALSALFFFLVTCVVLFSTLLYFAERGVWDANLQTFVDAGGSPSQFDSIPAAFWFVLVTITTTGYGDMVPTTFIGKLVTFPAMMFGVLLIALPSIIVGRNFTIVWELMRQRQRDTLMNLQSATSRPTTEGVAADPSSSGPINHLTPPGTRTEAVYSPPPPAANLSGFVFDNEPTLTQLNTLTTLVLQNQDAIRQILRLLEAREHPVRPDGPATNDQYDTAEKRTSVSQQDTR